MKSRSIRFLEYRNVLKVRACKRFKAAGVPIIAALLCTAAFTVLSDAYEKSWTDKTLESLSLREKIAQLVQIRVPGKFINRNSPEFQSICEQIQKNRVGGVVLFAGNVYESAILLNELQSLSKLPLLVASDFERGLSFRIEDTTSFPWTMALGAADSEQFAYRQGIVTGEESRALGVHWIFAPVVDVNNNPENPVINIRSFGEDPALVARLAAAFIRGAKKGGVLTTAKHFPGHGDTATDSHIGLAVVESDMARLQAVEFTPFRSAIEAGVDAIMTAHVAVPQVTNEPDVPATLSSKMLTDLLRDTLKFDGIVVTDALEMGSVTNHYWCGLAAIRAIQAGADVLLLPPDATVAINEVERAVRRGDISESRIDKSVRKILNAKYRMGLHQNRLVDIGQVREIVASPENLKLAQEIADHSITAVKDEHHLLPVNPLSDTDIFSLVLSTGLDYSPGSTFQAELRRRFPSIRTAWANARIPNELVASIDKAVSSSDLIVVSTLVRLSSGTDALSFPGNQRRILRKLVDSGKPVIWVAFGNPYVLRFAPKMGTYICTFSYSDESQIAAAKALSGEIEIAGRMPVSLPPYSKTGDGLEIPKLEMTLKPQAPEILGLSKNAFEDTGRLLTSLVESGIFHAADLLVGYRNSIAAEFAAGSTGGAADSAGATPDTIYDLNDLSGIIGTASAVMLAADSGSLIIDAPVKDYTPELISPETENLSVWDLLADFSHAKKPDAPADSRELLLREIVSRTSGIPFKQFLTERLFEPLGMKRTYFDPPKDFDSGIAYSAPSDSPPLFCSARDLAIFAQMLLNRGLYDHRRFLKSDTIARFTGPRGPWVKPNDSDLPGGALSSSAFGYRAATGSFLWIDPARKLFLVFLADGSPRDRRIQNTRKEIVESVMAAIPR